MIHTLIHDKDSVLLPIETCSWDFRHHGVPLHLDCRILERGVSPRPTVEEWEHPYPPFSRLFMFQEGGADVLWGDKPVKLEAGLIYLLPPGQAFQIRYGISTLVYMHLHVSDVTGESVFNGDTGIRGLDRPDLFAELSRASVHNETFDVFGLLTRTIGAFIETDMGSVVERSRRCEQFSRLFGWLKHQPLGQVTVTDAAGLYNLTTSAFSKRFGRTMGVPFKDYLTKLQISQAQYRLLYTDQTIAEIAEGLGYVYPQYFHRFFRRHCNCTPAEYRRHGRGS
jgi:AraC-like DNA-binding protein